MNDPISDFFTRIRNAHAVRHPSVRVPSSRQLVGIAALLKKEGYVSDYVVETGGAFPTLTLVLKYFEGMPVIRKARRISRSGCRVYRGYRDLTQVQGGLGIAIVSTPVGLLTDREARQAKIGGEILGEIE